MAVYIGRADSNYRVIIWGPRHSIYTEPAGVDDRDMAQACFEIACRKHPGEYITLQQGIRVIRKNLRSEIVRSPGVQRGTGAPVYA